MNKIINGVKDFATKVQVKGLMAKAKLEERRENGDHLLEVLGVIIIAVVILIFFRGALVNMFNTGMAETNNRVNNLFTTM